DAILRAAAAALTTPPPTPTVAATAPASAPPSPTTEPKKAPTVDEVVKQANDEVQEAIGNAVRKTSEEFIRFLRGEKDTSAVPFDPKRHIRQGNRWGLVSVDGFGPRVDAGQNWDGAVVVADMKKMSCYESILPFQGFRWTPEFRA
ncbi:MAG: hypothetical protein AAB886_01555, partial [Patescibacteria group bacterium]